MRWTHTLTAVVAALVILPSLPVHAAKFKSIEIDGLLENPTTGEKIERRILRKGAGAGASYRVLDALYVIHVQSEDDFESLVAPALEGALDSDRPIESLRAAMFAFDDADALLSGPEAPAVMVTFDLPGERGQGFAAFGAPIVLGPDVTLVNHTEPNKIRVVTGVSVSEADDEPVLEALGLKSTPDQWTGGRARMPKLNPLPDDGEGAWVKYKGRSYDGGEDLYKRAESVDKIIRRDSLRLGRAKVWPGSSGDKEGVRDVLSSARYRTRAIETEDALSNVLRHDRDSWEWDDKRIKHPTRYGIATLAMTGEVDEGRGLREQADILVYVYFYTPLFIGFEEAHLYCQTSPEFFATSVQKGELPFFEVNDKMRFYRGHLDRWLQGLATDFDGGTISRRSVDGQLERWARDIDPRDARAIQGLGKNPGNWPLRMVARDDDGDSDKTHKMLIAKQDLANWLAKLKPSFEPDYEPFEEFWTLRYQREASAIHLGTALRGGSMNLDTEDLAVAAAAPAPREESRRREEESLSERDRERIDEQSRRDESERAEADERRRQEQQARDEQRRRDDERRAEEERQREEQRLAALEAREAPIEVRLRDVLVGTRSEGKPYLATRAGSSVPIKIAYNVGGEIGDHKLQVVSQAYDPSGEPVEGFAAKSTTISPREGEGSITTYLKVPSHLSKAEHMGSYLVLTRLEIDGVPAEGEREEFIHLGKALQLHKAELDPAVVIPGDEAELLMDLQLGGWSVEDEIKLTVRLDYTVDDKTNTDEFSVTRSIGYHELGIDVDIPDDVASGNGTWKVTVWEASGNKASQSGGLTVFAQELVEGGRSRSGSRRRVDEEDDDPLASVRGQLDDEDDDEPERDYVKSDEDERSDEWDFEDVDFDEFEDERTSDRDDRKQREDRERRERAEREEQDRSERAEREERDRKDRERAERQEAERRDRERAEQEEAERRDRERAERERAERAEREQAERAEREQAERRERERAEQEEAERRERERAEQEERKRAEEEERKRREEEENRKEPEIDDDLFDSLEDEDEDDTGDEDEDDTGDEDEDLDEGEDLDEDEDDTGDEDEDDQDLDLDELLDDDDEPAGGGKGKAGRGKAGKGKAPKEKASKPKKDKAPREKASKPKKDKAPKEKASKPKKDKAPKEKADKPKKDKAPAGKAGKGKAGKGKAGKGKGEQDEDLDDDLDEFEDEDEDEPDEDEDEPDEDEDLDLDAVDDDDDQDSARTAQDALDEDLDPGEKPSSEELDEADFPEFVFWAVDEEDVLLTAELESVGVMHIYGDAKKRTAVWLDEWEAAAADGAPEWYWILHSGIGPGEVDFHRYSNDAQDWRSVHSMPASFDSERDEKEARFMMRKVFSGFIPELEKIVDFGDY